MDDRSFLGTGFKFPIQVDPNTGRVMTSSDEENIRDAIKIVLGTTPGERPMTPQFGCSISSFVFGSADYTTITLLRQEVENALTRWEPRIKDVEVTVEEDPSETGRLIIGISYVVRATNNPFNIVYPFYINEGYGENAME